MKTYYFNIQSKGGAGKSMLTYLQALRYEGDENSLFVDLDSSTKTSVRQLRFIGLKKRVVEVDIFDRLRKIEREKLFQVLESVNRTPHERVFVDFGAPESEQLPSLFSIDFTVEEFKAFEQELNARFVFNVVVAGGTAYRSCFEYLKRIAGMLDGRFELYAYLNEFTFQHYEPLIEEVRQFAKVSDGRIKDVRLFGNIQLDRSSGQHITDNVKEGRGLADYGSFAARTIIRREIAKV
jgi:hypothetical protein